MTAFLLALIYLARADTLTGKVVKIADGDTVTILVRGNQVRVRLFGIDAPERGQDYSRKSREALAGLVFEKNVQVMVRDKDRYGRAVGDVYVGDVYVNEKMVHSRKFGELEREARIAKRGLWDGKNPIPPWEYRAQERMKKSGRP